MSEYFAEKYKNELENINKKIEECPYEKPKKITQYLSNNLPDILSEKSYDYDIWPKLAFWQTYFEVQAQKDKNNEKYSNAFREIFKSALSPARNQLRTKIESDLENTFKKFQELHLTASHHDLSLMPPYSFLISFSFKLRKPYISRDDQDFYVIDNPVKKEWVFKLPFVAPSQWKGCLHAAMVSLLCKWWDAAPGDGEMTDEFVGRRLALVRLFGNEYGVDVSASEFNNYLDQYGGRAAAEIYHDRLRTMLREGRRRGRLHFYPTYFKKIDLEVINRHDRVTGAGTVPVLFECVPEGEKGEFTILYVPYDLVGAKEVSARTEAAEDLLLLADGIECLFTNFGFGAKTGSAYGLGEVSNDTKKGEIFFNSPTAGTKEQVINVPIEFQKYLDENRQIRGEFLDEQGRFLSNNSYRNTSPAGGGSLNEYKKFRTWYEKNKLILRNGQEEPKPFTFRTFRELKEVAGELAGLIRSSQEGGKL